MTTLWARYADRYVARRPEEPVQTFRRRREDAYDRFKRNATIMAALTMPLWLGPAIVYAAVYIAALSLWYATRAALYLARVI